MPGRSPIQAAVRGVFHRVPALQALALRALDLVYQVALLPFRRTRSPGDVREPADRVAATDEYNRAAERYFATFENPDFLLDKPFSDPQLLPKHLIDAGVLIDVLRLRPGDVVAEIGAGSCWLSHMLNRLGCVTVAVDVSSTALQLGRRLFERDPRTNWSLQPRFLIFDGHRLPLEDESCDRIVVNDAFHHIPNQRALLCEMHRVLRADGMVGMSEPGAGHSSTRHSRAEATTGVLENELVLEEIAALASACGFRAVNVVLASPHVKPEIPARNLGAFMGGRGFSSYWKTLCSALEQHHYILLHKGDPHPTTARPGQLIARIQAPPEVLLRAGEPGRLTLRVTNAGDTSWVSGSRARGWTRLGAHLYRAPTRELIDFDWLRADLSADVPPGAQLEVLAILPPVPAPGTYIVLFDAVVEGVAWFADRGSEPAEAKLTVSGNNR